MRGTVSAAVPSCLLLPAAKWGPSRAHTRARGSVGSVWGGGKEQREPARAGKQPGQGSSSPLPHPQRCQQLPALRLCWLRVPSPPCAGSFVLSPGLVGDRRCPGHCPDPGLPSEELSRASLVASWEINPCCAPSTDHPGNLEEPGLCAGNWGCPSLPPQPGWCWRSSPGSRRWGRLSLVPRDAPSPSPTWEAEWQQEQGSELHGHPQAQGRGIPGGCPACPVPVWVPRDPSCLAVTQLGEVPSSCLKRKHLPTFCYNMNMKIISGCFWGSR